MNHSDLKRVTCKTCGLGVVAENAIDGECQSCSSVNQYGGTTGGIKYDLNFDRLEWFAYILKRAIANREPHTAYDACASMMNHFEQTIGASQALQDAREVDGYGFEKVRR